MNIFSAIGDSDVFLTLYEMSEDSSSTVSPLVKEIAAKSSKVVQETRVPSMNMKDLCLRFFPRKPLFLNLDIEGYGAKALEGNDWDN